MGFQQPDAGYSDGADGCGLIRLAADSVVR